MNLQRLGIDDLAVELVLGDVQTAALGAFHGHAGAHDLGEAVHIAVLNAQLVGDLLTHVLRAGLGAEDAAGDLELGGRVIAHLDGRVGNEQGVGGGAGQDIGLAVLEHLHLALGVARRGGDDGAAHGLAAGMRPQTAREQAVAVGHLDGGILVTAHHGDAAGEAVAPVREVVGGMPHHRRLARSARGGVDAGHVGVLAGEHAEGVVVAHVLLHHEGELGDVLEALKVVGGHARRIEALAVQRHVLVGVAQRLPHALELQFAQLLAGHRLNLRLKVHWLPPCP